MVAIKMSKKDAVIIATVPKGKLYFIKATKNVAISKKNNFITKVQS